MASDHQRLVAEALLKAEQMTKNEMEREREAFIEKQWNEVGDAIIYSLVIFTACIFYLLYAFGSVMFPLLILLAIFFMLPFIWCFAYGSWKNKRCPIRGVSDDCKKCSETRFDSCVYVTTWKYVQSGGLQKDKGKPYEPVVRVKKR